ncbi:alpha/beta hydrolase [Streptomyces sp. NPDC056244]|uniref:alpha/beta hydrolase n=1 Tax=Streptomyces sp. NPDC056244 TaxID=3345762 RepID=UPI0035D93F12
MASGPRSSRFRRTLLAALVAASVAVPVSGAARPAAVPAPAPPVLAPLTAVALGPALDARYAANRDGIRAAERMAANHGDRSRAFALRAMEGATRHFLFFDGRGGGRTAEVFGDLARARRIAVLVPGSDTSLDRYGRFRTGARALQKELGAGSAVIAWLGYGTPGTVSREAVTPGRAHEAAPQLNSFIRELRTAKPAARTALLCHSYGSVVCALAAPGLPVSDIVLYGSPGTGVDSAADLRTRATVWAGRGDGDWIADVPHTRLRLPFTTIGFGPDPVSQEFGARPFDAGPGGHSDYLKPGSVSLRNLARIVAGKTGVSGNTGVAGKTGVSGQAPEAARHA